MSSYSQELCSSCQSQKHKIHNFGSPLRCNQVQPLTVAWLKLDDGSQSLGPSSCQFLLLFSGWVVPLLAGLPFFFPCRAMRPTLLGHEGVQALVATLLTLPYICIKFADFGTSLRPRPKKCWSLDFYAHMFPWEYSWTWLHHSRPTSFYMFRMHGAFWRADSFWRACWLKAFQGIWANIFAVCLWW